MINQRSFNKRTALHWWCCNSSSQWSHAPGTHWQSKWSKWSLVEKFLYLGSTITSTLSLDEEITSRIGKAKAVFEKLVKTVQKTMRLRTKTKILIYQTCVLSTLLHGSETWTLHAGQERRLNGFYMRCRRKILQVYRQYRATDTEVLKRAGIQSLYPILQSGRLRWHGHIACMDDSIITKQILYAELSEGTRNVGRPKLRFKD